MANRYQVKPQLTDGNDYYIDIPDKDLLQIKDSHTGQIKFVNIKQIINNQGRTWKRIKFNNDHYIKCTPDHPFEIKGRGRIEAQDLHVGDQISYSIQMNNQQSNDNNHQGYCTIEQIDTVDSTVIKERAYDVTTESDYFDVSGIVSHNCRSFLQGWINPETGKDEEDGRMNLGVVTVNLPRIALEAHGDQDLFWEIFNERMAICHQALKYRIARCKQAKPENAPILFEYGAFGRLKPDEDVDKLFRNSRATVSLGYIGLYEVNTTFYGPNWEHNPKAHAFAELITKRMHDLCAKWEDEEGYHYSLYSTPQHLGAFTE